jgi:hypothetical protein
MSFKARTRVKNNPLSQEETANTPKNVRSNKENTGIRSSDNRNPNISMTTSEIKDKLNVQPPTTPKSQTTQVVATSNVPRSPANGEAIVHSYASTAPEEIYLSAKEQEMNLYDRLEKLQQPSPISKKNQQPVTTTNIQDKVAAWSKIQINNPAMTDNGSGGMADPFERIVEQSLTKEKMKFDIQDIESKIEATRKKIDSNPQQQQPSPIKQKFDSMSSSQKVKLRAKDILQSSDNTATTPNYKSNESTPRELEKGAIQKFFPNSLKDATTKMTSSSKMDVSFGVLSKSNKFKASKSDSCVVDDDCKKLKAFLEGNSHEDERDTPHLGINKTRSLTEEDSQLLLEELEERKDMYALSEDLEQLEQERNPIRKPKFNRECIGEQPRKAVSRHRRKEIFDIVKDLNMDCDETTTNRVSIVSSRTTVNINEKRSDPEPSFSFFEKINKMFGCIVRRGPPENKPKQLPKNNTRKFLQPKDNSSSINKVIRK